MTLDAGDRESLLKALQARGWFWEGEFIYSPNRMLWLYGRILWNGNLLNFHDTFAVRVKRIIAMKAWHADAQQHQYVVEDNRSLVSAFEEVLEANGAI